MQLFLGDCLDVLRTFPDASLDSLVTDPPAGIGFMGKEWDHHKGGRAEWVAWLAEVMKEAMRVLKPGAHGLVWAIPRTSHWTAMALEDAGFEVRDCVTHLFGSGFPKSMDISKAIDKAAGVERAIVSTIKKTPSAAKCHEGWERPWAEGKTTMDITAPATEDAKKWEGFGTALKPAAEFWWLVRKPCSEKTVAANVLKHGTGALNINASRVGFQSAADEQEAKNKNRHSDFGSGARGKASAYGEYSKPRETWAPQGRFPANLVLSHSPYCTDTCDMECPVLGLDRQSGVSKSAGREPTGKPKYTGTYENSAAMRTSSTLDTTVRGHSDSGGASRFFYCAKISSSERNAGLEHMPDRKMAFSDGANGALARGEESYATETGGGINRIKTTKNSHPTVKPKKLMTYLIRLITPPGGTVLDPFMGSGSTGVAAREAGFGFVGIEKEAEYLAIAEARIEAAKETAK